MFCGKYQVITENGKIKLKKGFGGADVNVLCMKTKEETLFVAVSADEGEIKEYTDVYNVIDRRYETIDDVLVLPPVFFESIKDEKFITVIGVGNAIEIIRNDSLNCLLE